MMENHPIGLTDRPPRYLIVIFCIFSVLVLGLGFFQVKNSVYSVFSSKSQENSEETKNNQDIQNALTAVLEEQEKDTDQDGLPDYDETYLYNTSPYLEDSDSDGLSDSSEIQNNTDPNCPSGTDCTRLETEESQDLLGVQPRDILEETLPTEAETRDVLTPSGAELRKMFSQSAEVRSLLENFTDEELEKLFEQSYDEVNKKSSDAAAALGKLFQESQNPENLTLEDLQGVLESLNTKE